MPQRSGTACCFYQEVEAEVKNLIPPSPDNYMSLGTVSLSDIPLYMTTSHFSGLLTISAIAGDRMYVVVRVFVFSSVFTCAVMCPGFTGATDVEQPKPQSVTVAIS